MFRRDRDIWDVVDLLITDTKECNDMKGKSFDMASSISQQLSFFSCTNIIINREAQGDIAQYLYCKDFNTSPFPGSYIEQPARWIAKSNIIKNALSRREERLNKKAQREAEIKGKSNGG